MATKNSQELWNEFCQRMNIASEAVPLFATNEDLSVQVHEVGKKSKRLLLKIVLIKLRGGEVAS